jgi:hypothetical protein
MLFTGVGLHIHNTSKAHAPGLSTNVQVIAKIWIWSCAIVMGKHHFLLFPDSFRRLFTLIPKHELELIAVTRALDGFPDTLSTGINNLIALLW